MSRGEELINRGYEKGEELWKLFETIKDSDRMSVKKCSEILGNGKDGRAEDTVRRMIAMLNGFFRDICDGHSIIESRSGRGVYFSRGVFSDQEMQNIINSVAFNEFISSENKMQINRKLEMLSDHAQMIRIAGGMTETGEISGLEGSYAEKIRERMQICIPVIQKAIYSKKCIRFRYVRFGVRNGNPVELDSDGNAADGFYIISPYRLVQYRGNYYVLGYYDVHEGELSSFRIDRMKNVMQCRKRYEEAWDVLADIIGSEEELDERCSNNFNMWTEKAEKISLKIRFSERLMRTMVSTFGIEFHVKRDPDGWYVADIPNVKDSEGFRNWIISLGDNVEVLRPAETRNAIRNTVERMLKNYR